MTGSAHAHAGAAHRRAPAPLVVPAQANPHRAEQVVTVMSTEGHDPARVDLRPGQRIVVGSCGCLRCGVTLAVGVRSGLWLRAAVRAYDDHWRADNLTADSELWCVDLEDTRQRIRVPAGRAGAVVPFEFTQVELRHGNHAAGPPFTVIGPEPASAVVDACGESRRRLDEAKLQPGTTYMAVIDVLCGSPGAELPSSAEISRRLAARGHEVTRRAVDHHIDYVYERLFPAQAPYLARPGWKRVAIASLIRAAGTVGDTGAVPHRTRRQPSS